MELLVLKMPPERVTQLADAIERDLEINRVGQDATDLRQTLAWLRYRISRWNAHHPSTPTA